MRRETVGTGYLRALLDYAVRRGAGRDQLLEAAGLRPDVLENHDARLPFASYVSVMRTAQRLTGDPALALHYGADVDLSAFSVVGLLALAAPTMGDALAQLNRFGALVVEVPGLGRQDRFVEVKAGGEVWIEDRRGNPNAFPELTESTFARMICGPRQFAPSLRVHAVEVTHPAPPHAAEYERLFECPVRFGAARNAMQTDETWTPHPVASAPRYVFGPLRAHAEELMRSLGAPQQLRDRVEAEVMPVLHTGAVPVRAVARALNMSRQTLFRRLRDEGTSFARIVEDLRHRLARDYLTGGKVSVNETAYLLGFSDPAAFSRAFKRWTGHSPLSWKQQHTQASHNPSGASR